MDALTARKKAQEINEKRDLNQIEEINKAIDSAVSKGLFSVNYYKVIAPSLLAVYESLGYEIDNLGKVTPTGDYDYKISW